MSANLGILDLTRSDLTSIRITYLFKDLIRRTLLFPVLSLLLQSNCLTMVRILWRKFRESFRWVIISFPPRLKQGRTVARENWWHIMSEASQYIALYSAKSLEEVAEKLDLKIYPVSCNKQM
jgi:hypothetical protein